MTSSMARFQKRFCRVFKSVKSAGSDPNQIGPGIKGADVIARTGYTGEPGCFELFAARRHALMLWELLLEGGAAPIGLGARDTLRLEAGLPLYGHELGMGPEGREIPIFSSGLSRFAVSFSPLKGNFVGRRPLENQFAALKALMDRNYSRIESLPRRIQSISLLEKGVARAGSRVFQQSTHVGHVTSGTMVPYWKAAGEGIESRLTDEKGMRAVGLALLDSRLNPGDRIQIEGRGKKVEALIVPYHLKSDAPPYARRSCGRARNRAGSRSAGASGEGCCRGFDKKDPVQPPLAPAGMHQPDSFGADPLPSGQDAVGHGPGRTLRRTQTHGRITGCGCILLPGHGFYCRG
jgi:hypothetical protein